jgi:hypothetical protein
MTRQQIEARITAMLDDYAYSDTWPESYQREYEELCARLYPHRPKKIGDCMKEMIESARIIAAGIREDWDSYQNVDARERKAATLLLHLADEVERLRPELKPEEET